MSESRIITSYQISNRSTELLHQLQVTLVKSTKKSRKKHTNPLIRYISNRSQLIRMNALDWTGKMIQSLTEMAAQENPTRSRDANPITTARGKWGGKEEPFGSAPWWFRRPGSSMAPAAAWASASAAGFGILGSQGFGFWELWTLESWGPLGLAHGSVCHFVTSWF